MGNKAEMDCMAMEKAMLWSLEPREDSYAACDIRSEALGPGDVILCDAVT